MQNKIDNIFLAAGGTGGHIFPAISLAEELEANKKYHPILVSDHKYLKYIKKEDFHVEFVSSSPIKSGFFNKIVSVIKIAFGTIKAFYLITKYQPKYVFGFGGYPCFPTLIAAMICGIPILIHEQNSRLGKVNKFFSKKAIKIATSFEETSEIASKDLSKVVYTGNPVRRAIRDICQAAYPEIQDKVNILVTGGSQGASVFSEIVPDAINKLSSEDKAKIRIAQQCRQEDLEKIKERYTNMGIEFELAPFFNDMPKRLVESHLVISRSGASTLAELAIAARPAILVPLPSAAGNHQMHNAMSFVQSLAGWVITQDETSAQNIHDILHEVIEDPNVLQEASKKIKHDCKNAAKNLAALL